MKWKINSLQLVSLMAYPIIDTLIGISSFIIFKKVDINAYLCVILMAIIGIPYILMLKYVANYKKDFSLRETINAVFGRIIGTILNILLMIISFIIAVTLLFNITNFIISQFLTKTPLFVVSLLLIIVICFNVTKGFQVITRVSLIILVINLILFFIAFINIIPKVQLDNFKPILEHGLLGPMEGGILITFTNILPLFLLLVIPKNNVTESDKLDKYISYFYVISTILALLIIVATIGGLGKYLIMIYQYPVYIVLQKISFLKFIDRVENLIAMQWIFGTIMYLSLIIYYISRTIIAKKDSDSSNNWITIIIVISILIVSNFIFRTNASFENYIYTIFPYICSGILPIIILLTIGIFIKKKKIKKLGII